MMKNVNMKKEAPPTQMTDDWLADPIYYNRDIYKLLMFKPYGDGLSRPVPDLPMNQVPRQG